MLVIKMSSTEGPLILFGRVVRNTLFLLAGRAVALINSMLLGILIARRKVIK
jgi:hypothetical protein